VTVQAEILELLRDLRDRLRSAILLITHNMGVVADLADRVVVMNAGKVVETDTVAKLFAAPSEDYTRTLLAAVPHLGQGNPEHQPTDEQTEVVLEVDNLGVQFPAALKRSARSRSASTAAKPLAWWESPVLVSRPSGAAWRRCRNRPRDWSKSSAGTSPG
jgi:ABC-type microcin C transport system duplicated ATPase subunit YejF